MPILVTEIQIEPSPFVVVRALEWRHLRLFQPPFIGYHCFSGNLLHRNLANKAFR
jgi:hypothetical protein